MHYKHYGFWRNRRREPWRRRDAKTEDSSRGPTTDESGVLAAEGGSGCADDAEAVAGAEAGRGEPDQESGGVRPSGQKEKKMNDQKFYEVAERVRSIAQNADLLEDVERFIAEAERLRRGS